MSDVYFDIEMTGDVINYHSHDNYRKIYKSSNEDLKSLLSNIDISGKKYLV